MWRKVQSLPISARLVGAFVLVLAFTSGGTIVLATRKQSQMALDQGRVFADGASQLAFTSLVQAMDSADLARIEAVTNELKRSGGIRSLRVLAGPAVSEQYGSSGKQPESIDAVEANVLSTAKPFLGAETRDGTLVYRAVLPMIATTDLLGTNCTTCHQVEEGRVLGAVSLDVGLEHVVAESQRFRRTMLLATAGFGALLALGIWRYCRSITRPLTSTVSVLEALAAGDLRNQLAVNADDELGRMARALNSALEQLRTMVGRIRDTSRAIRQGSSEISAGNADLNNRTQAQASALGETAASVEQMTSTVRQSAENAQQAHQLVTSAREAAEKGGVVVGEAIQAMGAIDASSKKIAEIIGVIDAIAFQTNLLALNAAVEAARAGEHGRGFAVVATEVRHLAQRAAAAAKEIKALIRESVVKVGEGSKLVNRSGETLAEIVAGVKKVSDIIGEIATASAEQATGVDQINQAVTRMDTSTQENAALVEQSAAASEAMADQARDLDRLMGFFRTAHDEGAQPAGVRDAIADAEQAGSVAEPPGDEDGADSEETSAAATTSRAPAPRAAVPKPSVRGAPPAPRATATQRAHASGNGADDDYWQEF